MSAPNVAKEIVGLLEEQLGARLAAVYRFGSVFARGARAPAARLLVLVDRVGAGLLDKLASIASRARDAGVNLRIDTADNVLCSADVFPIFTLEFLHTRELLSGKDALADLAVSPKHLRLRAEQSLRTVRRDLLRAYIGASGKDQQMAAELRRCARRIIHLLEAVLIVAGAEVPEPPTPDALIGALVEADICPDQADVWRRLKQFAAFEAVLERSDLLGLTGEVIEALEALVGVVDALPADNG